MTPDTDHARLVEEAREHFPGAVTVHEWTYEKARSAFLRWMKPHVAHLPVGERLEVVFRILSRLIADQDPRVSAWALRLWNELPAGTPA